MTERGTVVTNFLYMTAGTALARPMAMLTTIVVARYFGAETYGRLSFARVYAGYFAPLIEMGIGIVLIRKLARDRRNADRQLSGAGLLMLCTSFASSAGILASIPLLGKGMDVSIILVIYALQGFVTVVAALASSLFKGLERLDLQAVWSVVNAGGVLALSYGLLAQGSGLVTLVFARAVLGTCIVFVVAALARRMVPGARPHLEAAVAKQLFVEALPICLAGGLWNLVDRLDIFLLSQAKGDATVGLYAAAYVFVMGLSFIGQSVVLAVFPALSRDAFVRPARVGRVCSDMLRFLFLVSLPIAVIGTVLSRWIIALLYGEAYAGASTVLAVLVWALVLRFAKRPYETALYAMDGQTAVLRCVAVGLAANVGLNLLLIPRWGMMGAAAATVVTEGVLLVLLRRKLSSVLDARIKVPWSVTVPVVAMAASMYLLRDLNIWLTIVLAAAVYGGCVVRFKVVTADELKALKRQLAHSVSRL